MARKAIHAAGGIVVRSGKRPLLAVVQRSKDECWVLPRGKLKRDENSLAGARREVVEETGHRVQVHEFLGAITYTVRGQPKVVQFWRMQAAARPSHDVSKDIAAVEWLPLAAAVRRLSFVLEKLFLLNVGRRMLRRRRRRTRRKTQSARARVAKKKAQRRHPQRRSSKKRKHRSLHRKPSRAAHKLAMHHATAPARRSMLARMLGRLSR